MRFPGAANGRRQGARDRLILSDDIGAPEAMGNQSASELEDRCPQGRVGSVHARSLILTRTFMKDCAALGSDRGSRPLRGDLRQ
jgi:hypothetical protein